MEEVLLSEISAITDCAVVAGRHEDRIVPVAVVIAGVMGVDSPVQAGRLLAEANAALERAGHPRVAVLDVARTPDDFPVGVTGKVLKRELRARYSDLAESPCRLEHRAVAPFLTRRRESAVA
jgi:acyl-coenzyme A synthetase/AMP-(fatty) acid ligase